MPLTTDFGKYKLASFIDEQRVNLSLIHIYTKKGRSVLFLLQISLIIKVFIIF